MTITFKLPDGNIERKSFQYKKYQRESFQQKKTVPGDLLFYGTSIIASLLPGEILYVQLIGNMNENTSAEWKQSVLPYLTSDMGVLLDTRYSQGGTSVYGQEVLAYLTDLSDAKPDSSNDTYLYQSSYEMMYAKYAQMFAGGTSAEQNYQFGQIMEKLDGDVIERGQAMLEHRYYLSPDHPLDRMILSYWNQNAWNENPQNYDGITPVIGKDQLIVLADYHTPSSAETLVEDALNNGVTVVGTNTRGVVGSIIEIDLMDGLKCYFTTQQQKWKGDVIHNVGYQPSILVNPTQQDFRDGFDAIFEFGKEELLSKMDQKENHKMKE